MLELFAEREEIYLHATEIINNSLIHVYNAIIEHFELDIDTVDWHDIVIIDDNIVINCTVNDTRLVVVSIPIEVAAIGTEDAIIDYLIRIELNNKKQMLLAERIDNLVKNQQVHNALRKKKVLH